MRLKLKPNTYYIMTSYAESNLYDDKLNKVFTVSPIDIGGYYNSELLGRFAEDSTMIDVMKVKVVTKNKNPEYFL